MHYKNLPKANLDNILPLDANFLMMEDASELHHVEYQLPIEEFQPEIIRNQGNRR